MVAKLTVDKLGRIVLPKPVRDKLQLAPGDKLKLEILDDRITLRPVRGTAQLRKKRGIWVSHCGEPLAAATVQRTLEQVRRERDEHSREQRLIREYRSLQNYWSRKAKDKGILTEQDLKKYLGR